MKSVRCEICRQQLPTLKNLITHYLSGHSKLKIVKQLLKLSILRSTPSLLTFKKRRQQRKTKQFKSKYIKTETLYLEDNIHIFCGQNEIIIGDEKSSVDMEFSFDENSNESKENYCVPLKEKCITNIKRKTKENINNQYINVSTSPSTSSEDGNRNRFVFKRKLKRKKESLERMRHYHINITKLKEKQSLNEKNGEFYICNCRDKTNNISSNLRILTSDTESASDTGKNKFAPIVETKVFCSKCGNGYKTDKDLAEHMKIHEMHCRVCNEIFPNEREFKEHIQGHIFKVYVCHVCQYESPFEPLLRQHFECHLEDNLFETVVDMEEDYRIKRYNFSNINYRNSIHSILCFLSESHDIYYYSYKFMKIICDICFHEVFFCDYENHLKNVHYPYTV